VSLPVLLCRVHEQRAIGLDQVNVAFNAAEVMVEGTDRIIGAYVHTVGGEIVRTLRVLKKLFSKV